MEDNKTGEKANRPEIKTPRQIKKTFFICLVVLLLIILALVYFSHHKNSVDSEKTVRSSSSNTAQTSDETVETPTPPTTPDSTTTQPKVQPSASDLYLSANTKFAAKDYAGAIIDLTAAIALNNRIADYYNLKSQAEYNLGLKDEAIKTVEAGLTTNPDDELLKSRLDSLSNNTYNDSNIDTPRQ